MESCLALRKEMIAAGVEHDWLTLGNESLITRARNVCASSFMYETKFQCLLFIDADIEFNPADVAKLWNLCFQGANVAVGPYRMKKPGAKLAAWVDGRLVDDVSDRKEPFEVDYAGTGFMMIPRKTFNNLLQEGSDLIDFGEGNPDDPYNPEAELRCWNFFETGVDGPKDKDWKARNYLPEDYWFCKRVKEVGLKITMDPTINLKHHGNAVY